MKINTLITVLLCTCFNVFGQTKINLDKILKQLNLTAAQCKTSLIATKTAPNNPNETIVVIPEIAKQEDDIFELNSHILIVDTKTSKITSRYYESSKTNEWFSDAFAIVEIKIDTAHYIIAKNKRAFGIRLYFNNYSKPNPYSKEIISLFVRKNSKLKNILKNYTVMEYYGEGDASCYGEFFRTEKILIMKSKKTNAYFDILVKSKNTKTLNDVDEQDECISKDNVSTSKTTLTFNGNIYL